MNKALVTGGAGFIGSHLVDLLIHRGWEVFVLDNLTTGNEKNIAHLSNHSHFHFSKGSILDAELLSKLIRQVDVVFHMAAVVGVKYIVENPLEAIVTNVDGTSHVLELAYRNRKKVILASSSEVYGKSTFLPYQEDGDRILGSTRINRWSYSAGKAIDEHLAFAYAKGGLPVVILRFFNTYGPRINEEAYGTVIAQFIKQALNHQPITVHGDGNQTRCFSYISDTVEGIWLSCQVKEAEGLAFNIGNPQDEVSVYNLALLIRELVDSPSEILKVPYHDYYGLSYEDTLRRIPSIERAADILKFQPKVSLRDGLLKTIEWCRANYTVHAER